MKCRFCKEELTVPFADLFHAPASNSFLSEEELKEPETFYPLKVFVCGSCFLVQVDEYKKSDAIFNNEYVYFSSYSRSWLQHAERYTEAMTERFGLNEQAQVVEIASNDGYLLQYFLQKKIPVLGIEPTGNTADVAIAKGIQTIKDFFGVRLATELAGNGRKADLLLGNNVLAHVPHILDFVGGMKILLKETGVITMEFPHLLQLIRNNQFDTIYHEHFSYLSFYTVTKIFASQGLRLFDVEELPTHGGSLRIYAKHAEDATKEISPRVAALLQKEEAAGLTQLEGYTGFQDKMFDIKRQFISLLIRLKEEGKSVAGYGAAAKGNTLLNYCGIRSDLIPFVVDANPHKQGKWLPGSHIPVVQEELLKQVRPDYVIIFPWNIREEVMAQLSYIKDWNGQFIIPIPAVVIL